MVKLINRFIVLLLICTSLSGCTSLGAVWSALSNVVGGTTNNSGSQRSITVDTKLSNQKGDNNYKAQGGSVDSKHINDSKVAGNNQNNYQADKLTVNQDSFWRTIGSFFFGFLLCGIAVFLCGWYLPQPKHVQKFKSVLSKTKTKFRSK